MSVTDDSALSASMLLATAITEDQQAYWVIMDAFAILCEVKRLAGDGVTAERLGFVMERMAIARRAMFDYWRMAHAQQSQDNGA